MKCIYFVFFIGLLIYSICLLSLDFMFGQAAVRGYFSDIVTDAHYPVLYSSLFGINTSISVCLLCGCSLLYLICIAVPTSRMTDWKLSFFLWSQVVFFLYVAADERLRIHEWLGGSLGVEDAFILLAMGALETVALLYFGGVLGQSRQKKIHLFLTVLFFALMVVVDAFIQPNWPGRLAVEDLLKLWAVVFLFSYAWCYTIDRVGPAEA